MTRILAWSSVRSPFKSLALLATYTCQSDRFPLQTGLGNNLYLGLCVSLVILGVYLFRRALTIRHTYSAILDNKIPIELENHVVPAALNAGLPKSSLTDLFNALALGTPAALAKVPGINPSIEAAVGAAVSSAYAAAYAYVYYAAVAVGLVGLIGMSLLLLSKSP